MKLLEIKSLVIPDIKVIRFARFADHRGYFTETYRKSDFFGHSALSYLKGMEFAQCNESYSKPATIRGLHFQWNPFMGKLVRTVHGRMVDLALDIRKGSPTIGKIIAYDMSSVPGAEFAEWIWVPPGFAHGNFFTEETVIEYFCSGEYSQGCEAGVSPIARDIDWSLCDPQLRKEFVEIAAATKLMTDKDRNGFSVAGWANDARSDNFIFGKML
jgi:dTDP-4-dehydrorhamnose 3,5-epimerase